MLVGLCGKKQSGKTAVAGFLFELRVGFEWRSFATPLKAVAQIIFGFSDEQLYGDFKEVVDPRYGLSARSVLQKLGTNVVREIHPEAWVMAWKRSLKSVPEGANVVVDDVRFPNEVKAIKSLGGIVLKLHKIGDNSIDSHASENTDALQASVNIYAAPGNLTGLYEQVALALDLDNNVDTYKRVAEVIVLPVDEHTRKFGVAYSDLFDKPPTSELLCADCNLSWGDHYGADCPKETS